MSQTPVTGSDVVSTQQTKLDANSKLQMDRTLELVKGMKKKKEKEKKSSGQKAKKEAEKKSSGEKEKKSSGETPKSAEAMSKAEPTSKMPPSSETQMDQASKMPSKMDQMSKMQSKMTPATKSKMKAVSKMERSQDRQKKVIVGKSLEMSIERSVDRKPKKSGGMKSLEKSLERSVDRKGKRNSGMKRRKAMNSTDSNDRAAAPKFNPGMLVRTKDLDWKVRNLLGSGGFGSVYMVEAKDIKGAMKVESVGSKRMKQELLLYLEMYKKRKQKKSEPRSNPPEGDKKDGGKEDEQLDLSHFPELYDRALVGKWQCIVMERLGLSLHDFRDTVLKKNFSVPTAMNIAKQALEAIRNLHRMGWVHRDLKPHNFVIGYGTTQSVLYLIDFGISRNIDHPEKNAYEPRKDVFEGTLNYAPGAAHIPREQGYGDDLESYLYLVFDCFDKERGLPWKGLEDMSEIRDMKLKFMSGEWGIWFTSPSVVGPLEMKEVVEYVAQLPTSYINYDKLTGLIQEAGEKMDVTFNEKADWIEEAPDKKEEEKKERKRPKKKRVEEVEVGELSEHEKSQEEKKPGSKAGSRAKSKQKSRLTYAKSADREPKVKKSKQKRRKKAEEQPEKPRERKSPESPKKEEKKEETQRLEAEPEK